MTSFIHWYAWVTFELWAVIGWCRWGTGGPRMVLAEIDTRPCSSVPTRTQCRRQKPRERS